MIGLIDYHLQTCTSLKLPPPNLELMKLAAYYKGMNVFCRLADLDEDFEAYDKIYLFSEYPIQDQLPKNILRAPNIIYGGPGFTNGVYVPFENDVIDYTLPRIFAYKEFLKEKYNDGVKTKIIEHILDDTYYRMYAGKNKLPIPPVQSRKYVFLYDIDFFYPDWKETIEEIQNRKCSLIIRLHPIVCNKITQFFDARKMNKIKKDTPYILDVNIGISDLNYLFNHYANYFRAEITPSTNIFLRLNNNLGTNLQFAKDFVYKINLLFSFWSENIPIKLTYESPQIGIINPFEVLYQNYLLWARTPNKKEVNFFDKFLNKKKPNEILKEQYQLLTTILPESKKFFTVTLSEIKQKGRWYL